MAIPAAAIQQPRSRGPLFVLSRHGLLDQGRDPYVPWRVQFRLTLGILAGSAADKARALAVLRGIAALADTWWARRLHPTAGLWLAWHERTGVPSAERWMIAYNPPRLPGVPRVTNGMHQVADSMHPDF